MSSKRQSARFWVSAWLPVLLGILMIAVESTEWMGADHTGNPLRILYQAIFGRVSNAEWETIHHYLRKTGHFVGYGLIGLAWLMMWALVSRRPEIRAPRPPVSSMKAGPRVRDRAPAFPPRRPHADQLTSHGFVAIAIEPSAAL